MDMVTNIEKKVLDLPGPADVKLPALEPTSAEEDLKSINHLRPV